MEHTNDKYVLQSLLFRLEGGELDLRPKFQREFVWGKKLQESLILSVFLGNPLGPITLWRDSGLKKVTDGKQRLSTLRLFHNDGLSIRSNIAHRIITLYEPRLQEIADYNIEANTAEKELFKSEQRKAKKLLTQLTQTNPSFCFSDLTLDMQRDFLNFQNPTTEITKATEAEISEYFRRIQHQEKLKSGEIINSIQSEVLNNIVSSLNDLQSLKEKLNFTRDRREFEKIYFSILGILERKLNLGTSDSSIVDYAEEIDNRQTDFTKNPVLQERLYLLNKNLNDITDLDINLQIGKSDLKFLFLLCAHNFFHLKAKYNLHTIMVHFASVVKKFKAFYSASRSASLKKYFPEGKYRESDIKRYEEVATLRKGSHNLTVVIEQMKQLSELIEEEIRLT